MNQPAAHGGLADELAGLHLYQLAVIFRKDGAPLLVRWPNDPMATASVEVRLPSFLPRTLPEACEVLGVALDADPSVIKKVGDALRLANHPDHTTDEGERQRREAKSKQINAAIELLTGKRKAA